MKPTTPTRPDLDALIERSKAAVERMTPAERDAMLEQQRQSWARGEAELAKDPRTR